MEFRSRIGLPGDMEKLIFSKLDLKGLNNISATNQQLNEEFKPLRRDALLVSPWGEKTVQALNLVLDSPAIDIPTMMEDLKKFSLSLQEGIVDIALVEINYQTMNTDCQIIINNIKRYILEQEQLLSECVGDDFSATKANQAHLERTTNQLMSICKQEENSLPHIEYARIREESQHYIEAAHAQEDVAALFSSQPKRIQTFLNKRYQEENNLKETFASMKYNFIDRKD